MAWIIVIIMHIADHDAFDIFRKCAFPNYVSNITEYTNHHITYKFKSDLKISLFSLRTFFEQFSRRQLNISDRIHFIIPLSSLFMFS